MKLFFFCFWCVLVVAWGHKIDEFFRLFSSQQKKLLKFHHTKIKSPSRPNKAQHKCNITKRGIRTFWFNEEKPVWWDQFKRYLMLPHFFTFLIIYLASITHRQQQFSHWFSWTSKCKIAKMRSREWKSHDDENPKMEETTSKQFYVLKWDFKVH